jgi:hypothetical protein
VWERGLDYQECHFDRPLEGKGPHGDRESDLPLGVDRLSGKPDQWVGRWDKLGLSVLYQLFEAMLIHDFGGASPIQKHTSDAVIVHQSNHDHWSGVKSSSPDGRESNLLFHPGCHVVVLPLDGWRSVGRACDNIDIFDRLGWPILRLLRRLNLFH